ncbi:MAG: hypothetical protein ACI9MC_001847 [Kiritimatiellia bacterium]|jgi:hypothetical protein
MNSKTAAVSILGAMCAVQAGVLAWSWMSDAAMAEEPGLFSTATATPVPEKLMCRIFKVDADQPQFTYPDGRTEAGNWALEHQSEWRIHEVDFEMGVKANGFPQPWVQVCLAEK